MSVKPKLIHPVLIKIHVLDKEKSMTDTKTNTVLNKVYKKEPIVIEAQQKFEYNRINRLFPYNKNFMRDAFGYFEVYADDMYELNVDGSFKVDEKGIYVRRINKGDWVKELIDHDDRVFQLMLFVRAFRWTAAYGKVWMHRMYVEDREAEVPVDEDGTIMRSSTFIEPREEGVLGGKRGY